MTTRYQAPEKRPENEGKMWDLEPWREGELHGSEKGEEEGAGVLLGHISLQEAGADGGRKSSMWEAVRLARGQRRGR